MVTKNTISAATSDLRLLAAVLEQLPLGVYVVEAPSGRLLSSSAYAEELVGLDYRDQEARRPGTHALVPPEQLPLARAARGETTRNELLEVTARDGTRRLIAVTATPIHDEDGGVAAAVSIFEDVTARAQRERAEREFVANAAHELRTPLAAIAGAVEVLQAGAKELPAERDRFLAHVERETQRLTQLARALLTLARAEMGTERPRLEIVALAPLLAEVAAATRPAKGVVLQVDCAEDLAVLAHRDLVEQALLNLAANAARYTTAGSIELSGRSEDGRAVVRVRDTGSGIGVADTEHAFERFYRGRSGNTEGYGLGLAIAKQAVRAAGGTLELEGVAGRSTTATIVLPVARLVAA